MQTPKREYEIDYRRGARLPWGVYRLNVGDCKKVWLVDFATEQEAKNYIEEELSRV